MADCREAVLALNAVARKREWPDRCAWQESVRQARGVFDLLFAEALAKTEPPIHPYYLAHAVNEATEADAIIVADGGETSAWMDMAAVVKGGGHWMSHGYLGCLGVGLPFAIAAKVAHPDRQVVCIIGDGSVGLNFAEFDTMVRHNLPIVTVVNNDKQWGMSAHGQDLIFGEGHRVVTDLKPTRYDLAAAGFGCHAEYVEHPGDLVPALERAFASGKPACGNVMTDPSVIAPITIAMVGSAASDAKEMGLDAGKIQIPYYEDLDQ
jgi:acetolactate synthase-1/2/3 large subunit